jgi:two-component system, response regulator YesN
MENRQKLSAGDSHVRVLVVDDHPNTANMLARAISRLGPHVEVVSAASGLEALRQVEAQPVDILITDLMMPEMNGMELIETLNDQPSLTPAATFLLTAYDSATVREDAQRLHVKEVIAKPVHPEWICEIITKTMDELKQSKPASAEVAVKNLEIP